ncbi:hypothetical protein FC36_GL001564 [Ligilactobacillus equi DSM 15833 = JCM 10991]|uniref:Uncharacterized protein n=1 Tax=Ligilactobacillus equi DSM 15833 = JCM 10991 TaxID=1423740 RepID=A0A0R1TDJ1_9LACO|nr:hypothetical protein FC36_GL001564 [Ligilactobacillus equi DSM 15833 = JCM 10991]
MGFQYFDGNLYKQEQMFTKKTDFSRKKDFSSLKIFFHWSFCYVFIFFSPPL